MKTYYDETLQDIIIDSEKPLLRVTEVKARPDYMLALSFSNGESRVYDAKQLLDFPIYAPLREMPFFLGAYCDGCAVADHRPQTVNYSKIRFFTGLFLQFPGQ